MKRSFHLVAAAIALAIVAGCTPQSEAPRPDAARTTSTEETRTPSAELLLSQQLPTAVSSLTRRFGKPDTIARPSREDESPWGQWLVWERADGSILLALADDYSTRDTDPKAGVRYLELRSNGSDLTTVHGFVFGKTTMSQVETTLPGTAPTDLHARQELGAADSYQHSSRYDKEGIHTYFFFDERGRLQGAAQATFLAEGAD